MPGAKICECDHAEKHPWCYAIYKVVSFSVIFEGVTVKNGDEYSKHINPNVELID